MPVEQGVAQEPRRSRRDRLTIAEAKCGGQQQTDPVFTGQPKRWDLAQQVDHGQPSLIYRPSIQPNALALAWFIAAVKGLLDRIAGPAKSLKVRFNLRAAFRSRNNVI